ncbi:hypothetical protein [Streptomyces sp. NPDC020917]|uniref:hypothetical protein n=1 Tax=Streptomyces sp. NPDC020917 TaxID=3365102 RepID=UPI0037942687
MSDPSAPISQPAPPQPQVTTTKTRSGYGLLATSILFAGIGGGLLAWHPWDKDTAKDPVKNPQHIAIQKIGEEDDPTKPDAEPRPVYCMTNETGALYCMLMPNQYTSIQEESH